MTYTETAKLNAFYDKIKSIYRLKDVIRYNTRKVIAHENVAAHCFNVAVIALLICDDYDLGHDIQHRSIVKALLHDMPEMYFNDITHDVKEKLNLQSILQHYEDAFYKEHFPLYEDLMTKYQSIVDEVVAYADVLSVKQYIDNEIELGNLSPDIKEIQAATYTRLSKCKQALETAIEKEKKEHGTLA